MKKFFLYTFLTLLVLGGLFVYVLYTEGAFDKASTVDAKPFDASMKCEAGKCGGNN